MSNDQTEAAKEKWHYLMEHALGAEHIRNMLIERDAKIEGLEGTIDDLRESLETHFIAGEVLKKGSVEIKRLKAVIDGKDADIADLKWRLQDKVMDKQIALDRKSERVYEVLEIALLSEINQLKESLQEAKLRCLDVRNAVTKYHHSKLQSDLDNLDLLMQRVNTPELIRDGNLSLYATNERDIEIERLKQQLAEANRAIEIRNEIEADMYRKMLEDREMMEEEAKHFRQAMEHEATKKPEYTEEGVPMLPIPEFCNKWSCHRKAIREEKPLELRDGFMVCPLCYSSYGEPAEATNPD